MLSIQEMKLIFSHPTGNANVRMAVNGLARANLLYRFYTAIACFPGTALFRISSLRPFSEIRRRLFDEILKNLTVTFPWIEVGRLAASKGRITKLIEHEKGLFCIDSVYKDIDKRVAISLRSACKDGVKAVYAFEDGASFSFREGKRLGLQCLYDLPTGYWRASRDLLKSEHERWPDWVSTLTGFQDSEVKLLRKDDELALADLIFVASTFTAETLKHYPGDLGRVKVIPYGFPPVIKEKDYRIITGCKPLKLLFVGKLTQQKGLADLLAAVEPLSDDVELTLIGQKGIEDCKALDSALRKFTWIPGLPHHEILKHMREHDVLIFPSLFDGFGLVITEAMSQGTPVITTERTGGRDFIQHGQNGWLFNAGSVSELRASIRHLLHFPESIAEVGTNALITARSRPWSVYSNELNQAIISHLQPVSKNSKIASLHHGHEQ